MSLPLKTVAIVIAAWQVTCGLAMVLIGPAIGSAVYSVYSGLFGDVQESYGTYSRIATYAVVFGVTALATAVGVILLTVLERRRGNWRDTVATFVAWHAAVVAALVASEEFSLFWLFHRLDWLLFGVPDDLYSFRNVMLPRIVAWVLSSTTAIAVVLWLRAKVSPLQLQNPARPTGGPPATPKPKLSSTDENPYAAPPNHEP